MSVLPWGIDTVGALPPPDINLLPLLRGVLTKHCYLTLSLDNTIRANRLSGFCHLSTLQPATTDAFEWGSDSDEALDRWLTFTLNSYATVTAVEMQFPVGDTYLFDLEIYNHEDGQPFTTISVRRGCCDCVAYL